MNLSSAPATNPRAGAEVKVMEEKELKRRGRALIAFLVLALLVLIAIGLVSAFKIGFANGMASARAALIVYQIPATVFGWPRLNSAVAEFSQFNWPSREHPTWLTLDDIIAFFEVAFGWLLGIFSW
jgi:hypothetical protein